MQETVIKDLFFEKHKTTFNRKCQSNRSKVKTTLGDGTIVSDQVTFSDETDLVCEASLNGKNLEKKVTVKPRGKHYFSVNSG